MADIQSILDRKKAARRQFTIVLDSDLEQAVIDAAEEVGRADNAVLMSPGNGAHQAWLSEATAALEEVQAAARAESQTFVFESIGREAFESLRDEYPPTKAQRQDYRKRAVTSGLTPYQVGELQWDPEAFPAALIAASCVDPKLSLSDARELWDSTVFSTSELAGLFMAAVSANTTSRQVELGNG